MSTVVKAERLSKKYIIGHQQQERYLTLRDMMTQKFKGVGKRLLHPFLSSSGQPLTGLAITEDLWALKDVSFEISQGDRVGIIGRNGAGKSTLLKILSRITEPTEGRVSIKGRVASLLEVGTGFHPELTGRENIYLNGAVLGMTKAEIKKKFDEIVDFAELEKFLDTPAKRYSSGMYVRLAFAVAAHLEPEILLVDEVLAVGDFQFQEKCLGKMGDVAREGRTVLFVSHNLTSISQLCSSGIWLDNGQIRLMTEAEKAVQSYLASGLSASGGMAVFNQPENIKEAFICSVELTNKYDQITSRFDVSSPIKVDVTFCCKRRFLDWRIFVAVTRYDGVTVFSTTTWDYNTDRRPIEPGFYRARLLIPGRFLGASSYLLTVAFGEPPVKRHDVHENILLFEVTGHAFDYGRSIGLLAYPFEWKIESE